VSDPSVSRSPEQIRRYWDRHPLGTQFCCRGDLEIGSPEFFDWIRPRMTARFPWILDLIRSRGPALRDKRLLEIGCGMGFDTLEWARQGVRVTAVDLSPESVRLARSHLDLRGVRADVIVGNALDLPFDSESFDAVYSRGVLHHTGNTARAVREVRRVLRRGGPAFICHLYRRYSWMHLLSRIGRERIEFVEEDPPVTDFFTVAEIRSMFEGFRDLSIHLQHLRALPTLRSGAKAALYNRVFRPVFNLLPERLARPLAYKISVHAMK